MAIEIIDRRIVFTSGDDTLPDLERPLVVPPIKAKDDTLVAAVWVEAKVPYIGEHVGYYHYEGVPHPTQSDYLWWHAHGLAGAVLRPHLRARKGMPRKNSELLSQLFPLTPEAEGFSMEEE